MRQAINYAIDVDRIIERLISGRGTRAAGVIPPALGGYDSAQTPYPYDPAKAKQLLAAAGHPNGIDIELWTSVTPIYLRIAETIQAYLERGGNPHEDRAARVRRVARRGARKGRPT